MSEPEALLAEGARRAAVALRTLWPRARPAGSRELPLAAVTRRLELFLAALYGNPPPIVPADPPPAPTWLARVLGRAPRHLVSRTAVAATDGSSLRLPRTLPADAPVSYKLLAVEQAARAARGTPACATADRLQQDLALLAEAAAIDRQLARAMPGLAAELQAARRHALCGRPALDQLAPPERTVERLVQEVLATDVQGDPPSVPSTATPAESLAWARTTAAHLRASARGYRGVAVVPLWGTVLAPPRADVAPGPAHGHDHETRPLRRASLRRRPRERRRADEDDERPGTWIVRADDPMESVEDPMGLNRPVDRDEDADPADLADALSELPEARVVETPGTPREVLDSDTGAPARVPAPSTPLAGSAGIVYPEWDCRARAYRARGAVVHPGAVPAGSDAWVDAVMSRHAALVHRVRRRFDGLRPRRVQLGRQPDGAEVDLAAYVTAVADWRAGAVGDDRFYRAAHPARRDLAIALLIDVSASTDSWVGGTQRIIDVEKESLVVLLDALDALGDRHAAYAFSGEGPGGVRVRTIKDFDDRTGPLTRRRVAALEPDGYTRAGAAIRHVSARLAREAARHRLLLLLSDGKPNDVDAYGGRYGVEDTRQAVVEARGHGLVPFCLTVDREAPVYMPRIFGPRGYAVLRGQDLLPGVLVEVVRRLLTA